MARLTSISYLEVNKSKGAWKREVAKGSRRLSASLRWSWRCAAPSKEACYHGLRWREEREVEREREEWQGAIYNWQPSSLSSWSWRGFNCFIDKQTNKQRKLAKDKMSSEHWRNEKCFIFTLEQHWFVNVHCMDSVGRAHGKKKQFC